MNFQAGAHYFWVFLSLQSAIFSSLSCADKKDILSTPNFQTTSNGKSMTANGEASGPNKPTELNDKERKDETALEPAPVGGAYLTCQAMPAQATLDTLAIACALEGNGLAASLATDFNSSFTQGPSRAQAVPVSTDAVVMEVINDKQKVKISFKFSRQSLSADFLFVDIIDKKRQPEFVHKVDVDLRETRSLPLVAGAVHIGESPLLAGLFPAECDFEMASVQELGASYTWNFEVTSAEAVVDVNMKVCGIDPMNNKLSTVSLLNMGGAAMASLNLERETSSPRLLGVRLLKGTYRLAAVSYKGPLSPRSDDILISGLVIRATSGQIQLK